MARAQVWQTCVHTDKWGESASGNYMGIVFPVKKKKIIRSVKGLQGCSFYTQQHGHCFALKEKKVGNQLKYICVQGRNLLYVKYTDRLCDRLYLRLPVRPSVKQIVSLHDVTSGQQNTPVH